MYNALVFIVYGVDYIRKRNLYRSTGNRVYVRCLHFYRFAGQTSAGIGIVAYGRYNDTDRLRSRFQDTDVARFYL